MLSQQKHRLEAARRRLDDLFEGQEACCLNEVAGVICRPHEDIVATDPRDDPDYLTVRDLLDEAIESSV